MSEFINTNGEKEQLNPGDYDFGVAEQAAKIQANLRLDEKNTEYFGDIIEGRIAQRAGLDLEEGQAKKVEEFRNKPDAEMSRLHDRHEGEVEKYTQMSKDHYQQHKDQYVENAKQEYAAIQTQEQAERVEDAREDVEEALDNDDELNAA